MGKAKAASRKKAPPKQVPLKAADLFDCKDLSAFIASIVRALPYEGASGSHFYLCEAGSVRFLTKMVFYPKSPPILYGGETDTQHNVDAEIGILRELKRAVTDAGISPCILELVYWKICTRLDRIYGKRDPSVIPRSIGERIRANVHHHSDLVKAGLAYDKCAFLVLDHCDITFGKYIARGLNTAVSRAVFKSLLFQVIYTLWAISQIYPRFRHGDLHVENVMLKIDTAYAFDVTQPRYIMLGQYAVPYFGIIAKIIDFGHSSLPEKNIVSDAVNDRMFAFHRTDSDLLLLLHWIETILVHHDADPAGHVAGMLNALDPAKLYARYDTDYIRKNPKLVPQYPAVIASKLWDEYRREVPADQIHARYTTPPH